MECPESVMRRFGGVGNNYVVDCSPWFDRPQDTFELKEQVIRLIGKNGIQSLVLNLTGVRRFDAAKLGLLANASGALKLLEGGPRRLIIVGGENEGEVSRALELMGADKQFEVVTSVDKAKELVGIKQGVDT